MVLSFLLGAFNNYVDKIRWVGGPKNTYSFPVFTFRVNNVHIEAGRWSKKGKNHVHVVVECPLTLSLYIKSHVFSSEVQNDFQVNELYANVVMQHFCKGSNALYELLLIS